MEKDLPGYSVIMGVYSVVLNHKPHQTCLTFPEIVCPC